MNTDYNYTKTLTKNKTYRKVFTVQTSQIYFSIMNSHFLKLIQTIKRECTYLQRTL